MHRNYGHSVFGCLNDPAFTGRKYLYDTAKDDLSLMRRMKLFQTCDVHNGCVNTISWNDSGSYILSGSDDHRLKITDPFRKEPTVLVDYKTAHRSNIFSAKFLPKDEVKIASCSGDGIIYFTNLSRSVEENASCKFNCHEGTAYKIITISNEPNCFLSCGEDHTVRFFDLRMKESCHCVDAPEDVLINAPRAVVSMAFNPMSPWYLAVGVADSSVKIYDRRKLSVGKARDSSSHYGQVRQLSVPQLDSSERLYRITSVSYSKDGNQVLASYSSDHLYLFDLTNSGSESGDRKVEEFKMGRKVKPHLKRLRLRGDWSDTGPNARPQTVPGAGEIGQARPTLHQSLMERMTQVLSQMLSESTRNSNRNSNTEEPVIIEEAPNLIPGELDLNEPEDGAAVRSNDSTDHPQPSSNMETETSYEDNPASSSQQSSSSSSEAPQVEDQFTSLRNSFINRHQREPRAVCLCYREGGGSAGLISLSVGNELERSGDPEDAGEEGEEEERNDSGPSLSSPSPISSPDEARTFCGCISSSRSHECGASNSRGMNRGKIFMQFRGHRNARTMIKEANFYGDKFILSGSDCGHIFVWNKYTGELVQFLEADNHVVNNVQPHPFDPIIASSGIDYNIKLFAPLEEEDVFNSQVASDLMKTNEIMLEETKDTITVPATFMIRMLSCLSHLRRNGRERQAQARRMRNTGGGGAENNDQGQEPPPPPNPSD